MKNKTLWMLLGLAAGAVGVGIVRRRGAQEAAVWANRMRAMGRTRTDLPVGMLACPHCRGRLALQGSAEQGVLSCTACNRRYPVIDGIPRFIEYAELPKQDRRFAQFYDWVSYLYLPFSRIGSILLGGEGRSRAIFSTGWSLAAGACWRYPSGRG